MKLSYSLTLADYKAALALHTRQTLQRRMISLLTKILVPIAALLGLSLASYSAFVQRNFTLGFATAATLLIFLCTPLLSEAAIRKQFKSIFPPSHRDHDVTMDIDQERIISSIPGTSESRLGWETLVDFAQDEKATLFYVRTDQFLLVPTRVMSPAQRAELSDLVARNLVRK